MLTVSHDRRVLRYRGGRIPSFSDYVGVGARQGGQEEASKMSSFNNEM